MCQEPQRADSEESALNRGPLVLAVLVKCLLEATNSAASGRAELDECGWVGIDATGEIVPFDVSRRALSGVGGGVLLDKPDPSSQWVLRDGGVSLAEAVEMEVAIAFREVREKFDDGLRACILRRRLRFRSMEDVRDVVDFGEEVSQIMAQLFEVAARWEGVLGEVLVGGKNELGGPLDAVGQTEEALIGAAGVFEGDAPQGSHASAQERLCEVTLLQQPDVDAWTNSRLLD
jgi:hypothetical protein